MSRLIENENENCHFFNQEKQFMILKVLISSDDKLINLNEAEKRSLAILRQKSSNTQSPGGM